MQELELLESQRIGFAQEKKLQEIIPIASFLASTFATLYQLWITYFSPSQNYHTIDCKKLLLKVPIRQFSAC